jgi:hypothetical protein
MDGFVPLSLCMPGEAGPESRLRWGLCSWQNGAANGVTGVGGQGHSTATISPTSAKAMSYEKIAFISAIYAMAASTLPAYTYHTPATASYSSHESRKPNSDPTHDSRPPRSGWPLAPITTTSARNHRVDRSSTHLYAACSGAAGSGSGRENTGSLPGGRSAGRYGAGGMGDGIRSCIRQYQGGYWAHRPLDRVRKILPLGNLPWRAKPWGVLSSRATRKRARAASLVVKAAPESWEG